MKLEDFIFIGMCIMGIFVLIGFYQAIRDVSYALERGRLCYIRCESGRWIMYYEKRDDIIANGDTKRECKRNLLSLYKSVMKYEQMETEKSRTK